VEPSKLSLLMKASLLPWSALLGAASGCTVVKTAVELVGPVTKALSAESTAMAF